MSLKFVNMIVNFCKWEDAQTLRSPKSRDQDKILLQGRQNDVAYQWASEDT